MNILITGSTKGSGLAEAILFLARGDKVFGFSRNQTNIDDAIEKMRVRIPPENLANVSFVQGDVSSPGMTMDIIEKAIKFLGNIDMLVVNVGDFAFDDELSEPDNYRKLLQTNVYGNARFIEMVIEGLKKDEKLILAVMGSVGAIDQMSVKKFAGTVLYNQSKAKLVEYTIDLAKNNPQIYLRAIHPGPFSDSAQKIADKFNGSCWATSIEDVAKHAVDIFTENTNEKITHGMIASEMHPVWENLGDIEKLGIEGLTQKRSIKIPEDKSVHFFPKEKVPS